MPTFADQAIDAITATAHRHTPGTRPIHAPGIGVSGWFEPSPVAARYSCAEHFARQRVPVTVRFSNGTGSSDAPDGDALIRGMAVRFHLDPPAAEGQDRVDMVCMSLPIFFVKTADRFLEFVRAATRVPVPRKSFWRKRLDDLTLRTSPRGEKPGDAALVEFADRYPPARLAVVASGNPFVPKSYATVRYHTVHAFKLLAESSTGPVTRWARFHWEPIAGVVPAEGKLENCFLQQELRERLARGPAEFVLRMTLAEAGDDTSDCTTPWPESRRRVVMGHLWLGAIVADQDAASEGVVFDPTDLVRGLEVSDDEILAVRSVVYQRSFVRRTAARGGAGSEPSGS